MVLAIAPWRAIGKPELVKRFRVLRTKTETDGLELVVYLLTVDGVWDLESPKERQRDQEEVTGPGMYLKGKQNGKKTMRRSKQPTSMSVPSGQARAFSCYS